MTLETEECRLGGDCVRGTSLAHGEAFLVLVQVNSGSAGGNVADFLLPDILLLLQLQLVDFFLQVVNFLLFPLKFFFNFSQITFGYHLGFFELINFFVKNFFKISVEPYGPVNVLLLELLSALHHLEGRLG